VDRFRPFRTDQSIRDHYAEVILKAEDLICPYFVVEGEGVHQEIPSLTDVFYFSIDELINELSTLPQMGINKILLFGVVDEGLKDKWGRAAYQGEPLIVRAIKAIKSYCPLITVMSDVCLCGYTDHGHCEIDSNDETLPFLADMALVHARAGVDYVSPSAMMDGQVQAIRERLDSEGFQTTKILAYSAKYASNFYGPFRDTVHSTPAFGDRKTYQMDFRNVSQALDEVRADIDEGADWVMVKPAHTYLDVIKTVHHAFPDRQVVAYHVSGEYMMLKSAAKVGIINEIDAVWEVLTAIKRAGATLIITYYAKMVAAILVKPCER